MFVTLLNFERVEITFGVLSYESVPGSDFYVSTFFAIRNLRRHFMTNILDI